MTTNLPAKQFLPDMPRSAASVFAPIQREFDRLFDRLGDGWASFSDFEMAPRMDVHDTDDGVEISVELPGIDRKDVKIAVEDDVLTISGEKKTQRETREADCRLSERTYGSFSRSITLPSGVEADKIDATLRDGVLTVKAPRNGKAHRKTISIKPAA